MSGGEHGAGAAPRATITVFGSNRVDPGGALERACAALGAGLARAGFVICNGGYGGTMAAVAAAARAAGGTVVGVTVGAWGPPNEFVTRSVVKASLLERLETLVELGDAFAVLPGGTGTLLEIALVLESQNKGLSTPKPLWFLGDFWRPAVEAALAHHAPHRWVAGALRRPDITFFATAEEIVRAAEAHFPR